MPGGQEPARHRYHEGCGGKRNEQRQTDQRSERQEQRAQLTAEIHQRQHDGNGAERAAQERKPDRSQCGAGNRNLQVDALETGLGMQ